METGGTTVPPAWNSKNTSYLSEINTTRTPLACPLQSFSQRQLTEEGRMIMVQAYSRIVKSHVKREVPDEKHIQVDIYRKVSIAQCSNAYAGCT